MAGHSDEKVLVAIIRAALGRPEGEDLAVLEAQLEGLEPTPGPAKAPAKAHAAATKGSQGARPDRDAMGRRLNKPYGLEKGR